MISFIKPHLVDDLSEIWKRWSVKIVAWQAVVIATWAGFSAVGLVPDVANWVKWTVVGIFTAAALTATAFKQSNLPPQ